MRLRGINIRLGVTLEHLWQGSALLVFVLIAIGGFFSAASVVVRSAEVVGARSPTRIEAIVAIVSMIITGIVSRIIVEKLKRESKSSRDPPPPGIE